MLLLIARLLLAGVFAVAGVAKLADLHGARRAAVGFGVPHRLAPVVAVLVPLFELAVAIALLPEATATVGATGALVLLSLFTLAIVRSMIRGEAPDCHCFGRLHSASAGWSSLGRNLALGALASLVLVAGWNHAGLSAVGWIGDLSGAGIVAVTLGIVLVLLVSAGGAFMLMLLRQHGRVLLRLDELESRLDQAGVPDVIPVPAGPQPGLPVGAPAPDFELAGLYGETVTLEALKALEKPVLLLFSDPGCGPCNALLPGISGWQREHAAALTVVVITRGSADDNRAKMREHGVTGVLLDADQSVYEAYQAWATPTAVVVDAQGRIASAVAGGADAITELVDKALGGGIPVILVSPEPEPEAEQVPAAVAGPET